jgi:hypothetical protein
MSRALLALALIAACETPDLKVTYLVADGTDGYTCGSDQCADVPMACQAVLQVRVLRPDDPIRPFISICEDVPRNATRDLCAIAQIDLPIKELPRETLEVQVIVWPRAVVLDEAGNLDCGRVQVTFDATLGFPISSGLTTTMPAFGGRAFYHPGDTETFVTLGCTDVPSINQATCSGSSDIEITATVGDFENLPFSVSPTVADRLGVRIGEPRPFDDGMRVGHTFLNNDTSELDRTIEGPTPTWTGGVDLTFQSTACLQVEENVAQSTAALACRFTTAMDLVDKRLDLPGIRLPKATLDQVLAALQLPRFPDEGMTIGIVLDHVGNPVEGAVVNTTQGTVEYLNATRTGLVNGSTSSSGIFVSRDAAYGTVFATSQVNQTKTAPGGRVDGNVTVVMLQFDVPPIGG